MIRSRSLSGGRSLVAVILATSLALTALPGATLCVASDGHVAIEAQGSDCSPNVIGSSLLSDVAASPATSLHSCTDTTLGTPSLTEREGDANQTVATVLWRVPALEAPNAASAHVFDLAGCLAAAPPRSLSTVQLL